MSSSGMQLAALPSQLLQEAASSLLQCASHAHLPSTAAHLGRRAGLHSIQLQLGPVHTLGPIPSKIAAAHRLHRVHRPVNLQQQAQETKGKHAHGWVVQAELRAARSHTGATAVAHMAWAAAAGGAPSRAETEGTKKLTEGTKKLHSQAPAPGQPPPHAHTGAQSVVRHRPPGSGRPPCPLQPASRRLHNRARRRQGREGLASLGKQRASRPAARSTVWCHSGSCGSCAGLNTVLAGAAVREQGTTSCHPAIQHRLTCGVHGRLPVAAHVCRKRQVAGRAQMVQQVVVRCHVAALQPAGQGQQVGLVRLGSNGSSDGELLTGHAGLLQPGCSAKNTAMAHLHSGLAAACATRCSWLTYLSAAPTPPIARPVAAADQRCELCGLPSQPPGSCISKESRQTCTIQQIG